MLGSLGEKIGEGQTSDIHAWAPGWVVKAGLSARLSRHEARMTRAVFAAGGPAPEVFDEVTVEGRFGMVLPRFVGPTLAHLLPTQAVSYQQAGAILARLYLSVHKTPPTDIVSLESRRRSFRRTDCRSRVAGASPDRHAKKHGGLAV